MHLGFVDAFGFVLLGGFFVSSIDATTTRTGVALGGSSWFVVGLAGAILAGFVVGVVLAAVVGRMWPRQRVPRVLLLTAVLLAAAGALHAVTTTAPLIGFTLALAMGAEATLLETGGLLAAAARSLTDRLFGRGSRRWARYLRLWGAVAVGGGRRRGDIPGARIQRPLGRRGGRDSRRLRRQKQPHRPDRRRRPVWAGKVGAPMPIDQKGVCRPIRSRPAKSRTGPHRPRWPRRHRAPASPGTTPRGPPRPPVPAKRRGRSNAGAAGAPTGPADTSAAACFRARG
ncbi:DUF1275 domain-containing protein [Rhodococcus sp. ACPA1]|uniref:DUF1275 domain-containing protein n=1 Tax=Rhodococcus sp. ACPA1 TaxID=2028572 RepID=UPI00211C9732|nr:DUF1275 domain-containing protein [Rhodococcus sp. ACPA1]